ncbi:MULTISPECIES: serine O-acetyltransferase EpsC [Pedobacter]|uniref:Serine acetyltransferase n=1 Tax=Pedobacter heparinus (strain ATCC 13125 / DSM 2366 / CIP 104194 / JCM 7457 / NBRC 12017 / NCIMB 9290 / NRRL B-14731 / HIM 762-3) TaxID=485917 RepID=C6XYT5_PEDHD|nr:MULTISPECIES: serine O-acetyltransferase EpsC [Pedobacter]ACU04567.1 Serine O-acetyltransferase [Pedobacter heparinus DSM 2366]MBB5437584.1 serine O-acetyltransferase [Pedobacter sp. AK017]
MNEEFYLHIFNKQNSIEPVPSNQEIAEWLINLMNLLYPERLTTPDYSVNEIKRMFLRQEKELITILNSTKACEHCNNELIVANFFNELPELYRKMNTDITAMLNGDPAAKSEFEVIRSYPGFLAIALYRIAHALLKADVPLIPRIMTEYAHSLTGIDIHPGAVIGEYLYIDHGTGLVIGETTVIGNHVKLYQGVTLGALSVEKYMRDIKRHPTIDDHVIIYSGATILGGETHIGAHSIIGGNVWLTKSVPPRSTVYHQSSVKVIETKDPK